MLLSLSFALSLILNLLLASSASAELQQSPTGVEYVKRFAPSSAANGGCPFVCPPSIILNDANGNPVTILNSSELDYMDTYCFYLDTAGNERFCAYDYNTGAYVADLPESVCGASAPRKDNCTPQTKRELTKLEKVIRSRQYNPKRRQK